METDLCEVAALDAANQLQDGSSEAISQTDCSRAAPTQARGGCSEGSLELPVPEQ